MQTELYAAHISEEDRINRSQIRIKWDFMLQTFNVLFMIISRVIICLWCMWV